MSSLSEDSDQSVSVEATDDEYIVEEILNHRSTKNGIEFLLKWKGFSVDESTWEKEKDLQCDLLLEKYWESVNAKKSPKKPATKKSEKSDTKIDSFIDKSKKSIKILGANKENGKLQFVIEYSNGKKEWIDNDLMKKHYLQELLGFYEGSIEFGLPAEKNN